MKDTTYRKEETTYRKEETTYIKEERTIERKMLYIWAFHVSSGKILYTPLWASKNTKTSKKETVIKEVVKKTSLIRSVTFDEIYAYIEVSCWT